MSLLVPESGLLFWMLLSFGIVFFVLAKYGFPVITNMVDERKKYIDHSLEIAKEANKQLENIKAEGESIVAKAHEEEVRILNEASKARVQMIQEAKEEARIEGEKMMADVRLRIAQEREQAIAEIRSKVAILSVSIAEKIMRKDLKSESQHMELIDQLLDEMVDIKD